MKAPLPANEKDRLEALKRYAILDTLPEGEYDEITQIAAHICGCPIATISLIEEQRQWYKSRVGLDLTETPRDIAFCAHTIAEGKPIIVADASLDERFADNPVVASEPHVRFYAGVPLTTKEGYALGTLCVVDLKPRELSPEQTMALEALSRHVVTHLELRRAVIERTRAEAEVQRLNQSLERRVEERTAELHTTNEELKLANQAKTEFLTNMSHEIRTPLNAIIGMTDLMRGMTLDVEQADYVKTIHANGENLLAIVNDVLDFSKIEFGKLELESRPFNLHTLVREVMQMFSLQASQKQLALTSTIDPALNATFCGDAIRLRQILVNLFSNAIKFTAQGSVELQVENVVPVDRSAPAQVRFSVRDTGIGIAPAEMVRLFKVFSQVDASTTRTYGGSGLGLAICHKLVEMMGGTIRVESTPGQGSTFFFQIPLRMASAAPDPVAKSVLGAANAPMATGSSERELNILLVEDNLTNQKVAGSILRRLGYQADIANNGLEGVAAAGRKDYDLILMDVHMPGMDGFEATQQIRQKQSGARPRIVALTADVLKGEREKCLSMGMDDYASKPIKIDALKKIIQAVHNRQ